MSDFKTRLVGEKEQLDERREKLGKFIRSEAFPKIDPAQRDLLIYQESLMHEYSRTLGKRLDLLN